MKTNLYHYLTGIPKGFNGKVGKVLLKYSNHALQASLDDRYGKIILNSTLNTDKAKVIEIETRGNHVLKIVYRVSYNCNLDIVYVCVPVNNRFIVKTLWLNNKSDVHRINHTQYTKLKGA